MRFKKLVVMLSVCTLLFTLAACGVSSVSGNGAESSDDNQYIGQSASPDVESDEQLTETSTRDEDEVEGGYPVVVLDIDAGELSMTVGELGVEKANVEFLRSYLGSDFDFVPDGTLGNLAAICNDVSVRGLERVMEYGRFPCGCMQEASLIACYMFDIPYEKAWENGFWPQEDVETFVAQFPDKVS